MLKMKMLVATIIFSFILFLNKSSQIVFATEKLEDEICFNEETIKEIEEVYNSLPEELKIKNIDDNENNIMLFDVDGKIINEIHSDGKIIKVQWNGENIDKVIDTLGYKTIYMKTADKLEENLYFNNELISTVIYSIEDIEGEYVNTEESLRKRELAQDYAIGKISAEELENELGEVSMYSADDYIVNGKRMNGLLNSSDFLFASTTALTEKKIQSFLEERGSILKDTIQIYALNSNGNVYNTGRNIKPSTVIYNAAKNNKINPKLILVMLQKESGLITSSSIDLNSRALYYAMGYGATDSGDILEYTGFDRQVEYAAKWLYNKYEYESEKGVRLSVNGGKEVTNNGITYAKEITVDTYPAWVLYKYTPHVIDISLLPTIGGGNYLLLQVFEGWWSSWN